MCLTPKGQREAMVAIRRHRLVEIFLVKVMEFPWHDVHDEADDLGAAASPRLLSRMEAMAGYPKRCPHGEPIPNANGLMPVVKDQPLTDIEPPSEFYISRVRTHDPDNAHVFS